ncbi:unnamed protein product [Rhizoctonia solani]|uniref:Peptidase C14 caspase domain-containing protein n=1 Tax=Rhizoctonia solani TaxID=456999 RepID=A0A8H3HPJ5_9AGAM|nr:unnamed protein product [Rhizoctonia solani]
MSTRQRFSAYALIIAISEHQLVTPEPDARRLHDTLIQFGFSENSIKMLTGHGVKQRILVPGFGTSIDAECIVPYDTIATRGQILPIPDITISALLGEIAKAKGDYITLLLDCCHSGSGSRDANIDNNRGSLPKDLLNFDQEEFKNEDGDIWSEFLKPGDDTKAEPKSRSISTSNPGSFRYQGIKSHVLIASCGENEESFECSIAGQPRTSLFTAALLEALNHCRRSNMLWEVTCMGLFTRIKDFMLDIGQRRFPQTPQCEGYHRERHVFATPAFPHRQHGIAPITEIPERPGQYLIPVGELAGVRPESEFEIYDYPKGKLTSKGRFPVSGVDNRAGSMTVINAGKNLKLGPDAYAVLCILPSPLPIDLSPDLHQIWASQDFQDDLRRRLSGRQSINHFIGPVRPGHPSKLRVSHSASTGEVAVEPTDGRSRPIVFRRLSIPHLSDTLAKAVMFYYHLERQVMSRENNPFGFEVWELIESAPNDPDYLGALMPDRERGAITFHPNEETRIRGSNGMFGLRITNHAEEAYYIYIFYFDPNDFSITPIYLPPTDQPSVLRKGSLKIGYGNSGAPPLTFTIPRNLNTDPGYFKLFYSISPSEMSTIEQAGVDTSLEGKSRDGSRYQASPPPFGSVLYPMAVLNPRPSGRR